MSRIRLVSLSIRRAMVGCHRAPSVRLSLAAVVLAWLPTEPVWAQLPHARLSWIFPPGGKQGTEVEVTTGGLDLDDLTGLHFSHPGLTASPKMAEPTLLRKEPRAAADQFKVSIAPDVPPGIYEVRTVGHYGMSNARAFHVGTLPELVEQQGNHSLESPMEIPLETTINGRADQDAIDYYRFKLDEGQHVRIDCWAQRVDSRMDATLMICDSTGRPLVASRDHNRRDPYLDFTASKAGMYVLKVYDFIYGGGTSFPYRFLVSTKPYVDFVFPPAGLAGTKGQYTLYGRNLPGSTPGEATAADGVPLEQLTVDIELPASDAAGQRTTGRFVEPSDTAVDGFEYRLQTPQGPSNPAFISFATAPVVVEQEPNDETSAAQKLSPPCEYVGQSNPRGDVDWVSFEAKKGDTYWIEVISQRLGLPTDPYILVQQVRTDDKGVEQVSDVKESDDFAPKLGGPGFDRPADDAVIRFEATEDATYRILVRDLYSDSRGSPRLVYRLSIRKPQPDFRLHTALKSPLDNTNAMVWNPVLRKGGTTAIRLIAIRRDGFDGEIVLSAEGLPEGVTCPATTLGPGQSEVALVLIAAENAPDWAGAIKIVGKAMLGGSEVVRQARGAAIVWDGNNPTGPLFVRATGDIALAVTGETDPLKVEASGSRIWEMARAGKLTIPLKIFQRQPLKAELKLQSRDLPKEIKAAPVTIQGNTAEANVEINVDRAAPPGTYTFYLSGQTKLSYSRRPKAAELAEQDKQEAAKIIAELVEVGKKAEEARQAAEKLASDAANEAKKLADAAQAAATQLTEAENRARELTVKLAQVSAGATGQTAGDPAVVEAQKLVDEATSKAKEIAAARDVAQQAAAETAQRAKVAAEQKVAAARAAQDAAQRLNAAKEEQKTVDKRASEMAEAGKPKDIDMYVASTPMTVTVTEAPVTFAPDPPGSPLKQGQKIEIPVSIARLYGFVDAVTVEASLPGSVKGVKIDKITVAKDQTQGVLVAQAASDATPGRHELTVEAKLKYNGQDLSLQRNVTVDVEAVQTPETK